MLLPTRRWLPAYKVTLLSAFVASIFNGVFGLLMAWILTRYRFPGRTLLDALIDLPFALPTAVAGPDPGVAVFGQRLLRRVAGEV
ncbi:Sulfate transport system permease protein CysW [Raoultella terrigena]|uniref:Sulfate transport system permease protein CysW n=1 Tax=Raoultella terrigena TaxID=577 RepID=A0A4U9D4P0_RAOTE|nr:Sulfate transport system permease protein CysW [Raoultella terrigena]